MDFVQFYLGKQPDYLGRTLQEIWRYSDEDLETGHDFIQVLFPLSEPSQFVPGAPTLDAATVEAFRTDPVIQENLVHSFRRMLDFYGFEFDESGKEVRKAGDFQRKSENWLFPNDHNHLRITRILKCLQGCGLGDHAAAFCRCLETLADPGRVTAETLRYWKAAVRK